MKKLKIGIIGTGHLGKIHTKLIKDVLRAELVGVFDLNYDTAKAVASEYETNAFNELDDLFSSVDAVSIVATTSAHYEIMKRVFEKGVHAFVAAALARLLAGIARALAGDC